jgi:hypothetical protein
MTTDYHTPIPNGASADVKEINGPLAQLDQAIKNITVVEKDGHIIQDEGVDLPQQQYLDFQGAGVEVTNDTENSKTVVTVSSVQSIVAGGNVSVDNTDPENPVVSASGIQSVAAGGNVIVDNTDPENPIVSVDATWLSFTPTLYQNGSVSASIGYAEYLEIDNLVHLRIHIASAGVGSAGYKIEVRGIPVSISDYSAFAPISIGSGVFLDSGVAMYNVAVCAATATSLIFVISGQGDFIGVAPSIALAINDAVILTATYKKG